MMINALLAKILIGILYVGIILLFAWIWSKFKKKPVAGGTVGFFVGTVPIIMLSIFPTNVYVVFSSNDYTEYWVYGTKNYTTQSEQVIEINSTNLETTIINDSKETFKIEEVVYGNGSYEPQVISLYEGEKLVMDAKISYFFDDAIPDEIQVESGKYALRYWLRD